MIGHIYCVVDSLKYHLGGQKIKFSILTAIGGGCVILIFVIVAIVCAICRKRKCREGDDTNGGKIFIFYLLITHFSFIFN